MRINCKHQCQVSPISPLWSRSYISEALSPKWDIQIISFLSPCHFLLKVELPDNLKKQVYAQYSQKSICGHGQNETNLIFI